MTNSWNRLFPNCLKPLFQSEAKCETIDLKMTFIHTQIKLIFTRKVWHLASQPPFSGSTRGTGYEIRGRGKEDCLVLTKMFHVLFHLCGGQVAFQRTLEEAE